LTDDLLVKLVVTVIVLSGLLVWQISESSHRPDCQNCATDISASRKPAAK
jgi:hypothetical protein